MSVRGSRCLAVAAAFAVALTAGACGSDDSGSEPERTARLEVQEARFAPSQTLAVGETMRIVVRNPGEQDVSQVSVTIAPGEPGATGSGFANMTGGSASADQSRPIWTVDSQPHNGQTADPAVWQLGPLKAGGTLDFTWKVTPVQAGDFKIRWSVDGGFDRVNRVESPEDEPLGGTFAVRVRPGGASGT